ncbi:MAG: ABC transporter permease, partial [Gammaproteobacteria bacterium]
VLRFGPVSEWFIWPIPAIVAPFAGVFYPVTTLPVWMQFIAYLLPPSWVFEGMRLVIGGGAVPVEMLLWSFGLNVIYIAAAGWLFTRVYHYAVHTGLFARYSAESVT